MQEAEFISELARKLAAAVPPGVRALQADVERSFQAILTAGLARMNLPTREEFDIQRKVLERTREKLTALEADIAALREASAPRSQGRG
jgi:ubiquinone biosynthesis accessory factor UbiK